MVSKTNSTNKTSSFGKRIAMAVSEDNRARDEFKKEISAIRSTLNELQSFAVNDFGYQPETANRGQVAELAAIHRELKYALMRAKKLDE